MGMVQILTLNDYRQVIPLLRSFVIRLRRVFYFWLNGALNQWENDVKRASANHSATSKFQFETLSESREWFWECCRFKCSVFDARDALRSIFISFNFCGSIWKFSNSAFASSSFQWDLLLEFRLSFDENDGLKLDDRRLNWAPKILLQNYDRGFEPLKSDLDVDRICRPPNPDSYLWILGDRPICYYGHIFSDFVYQVQKSILPSPLTQAPFSNWTSNFEPWPRFKIYLEF